MTEKIKQAFLNALEESEKDSLVEDNTNDKSDDGEGMDKVQPKALKKKFKDRKDKDIDNDGDVDDSDEYLHKRRKAVSKAIQNEDLNEDPSHSVVIKSSYNKKKKMMDEDPSHSVVIKSSYNKKKKMMMDDKRQFIAAAKAAKEKGDTKFMFAGKEYSCEEALKNESLKEATDLYDKGGISMTRFSMGRGKMGLQITVGREYIRIPEKDIKTLGSALSKLNFRQGLREETEVKESIAGAVLGALGGGALGKAYSGAAGKAASNIAGKMGAGILKRTAVGAAAAKAAPAAGAALGAVAGHQATKKRRNEDYSDEVYAATAELLMSEGIDYRELSEEELNEVLGRMAKAIGGAIKRQTIDRVTTSGRADRAERQAAKAEKKAKDAERIKAARERVAAAKKREQDVKKPAPKPTTATTN